MLDFIFVGILQRDKAKCFDVRDRRELDGFPEPYIGENILDNVLCRKIQRVENVGCV
jgi:hypothetical protein